MNASLESDNKIGIVKHLYSSFLKRDFETILDMLSPDVEWGEPSNPFNPAGGTRHGHEGFLEWLKVGNEAEEILKLDIKQFLSNEDSVAVVGFTKCRARATNKTYGTDFVHLLTFRENKIVRFQEFFDTYIAGEAFRS
jgi:ketosteroid isomerase-like protein